VMGLPDQTTLSEETHWEKAAKTRMGKYLTQLETEFIFREIEPSKTRVIMDVGAEAGRFSLLAAKANITVVGLDIDSYSLKRLKLKNRAVALLQADARKIPLEDEALDAVFMIETLDYIPELAVTLQECRRILKPTSTLILSFGNRASLKAKLKGFRGKTYTHSYKAVIECLNQSGFAVKRKMGYSWVPFGRSSNSRLIPLFAGLETAFGLRRVPSLSPWVIVSATKLMSP
jgi:ubiquinone/menaquinone biosynthesis C-methylase UbiE